MSVPWKNAHRAIPHGSRHRETNTERMRRSFPFSLWNRLIAGTSWSRANGWLAHLTIREFDVPCFRNLHINKKVNTTNFIWKSEDNISNHIKVKFIWNVIIMAILIKCNFSSKTTGPNLAYVWMNIFNQDKNYTCNNVIVFSLGEGEGVPSPENFRPLEN